ncbi:MAG: hypothetical protein GYA56_11640 [Geobacteraceae bacterium]|nr:hypothetical protein [Geobacteraceae bacterium]
METVPSAPNFREEDTLMGGGFVNRTGVVDTGRSRRIALHSPHERRGKAWG